MKFDENRVYTALNADKLKVGSKVIVADSLMDLKKHVAVYRNGYKKIIKIKPENYQCRFMTRGDVIGWSLAYLIPESNTNSSDFEIKQAYNKGTDDMFEFCQEWFKEHKSLPGLVEVDLHLFWHKFNEKFDC